MSAYVYEKRKQYADKRFKAGICIDCPSPRSANGWRCESCRKRNCDNRKLKYRLMRLGRPDDRKPLLGGLGTDE